MKTFLQILKLPWVASSGNSRWLTALLVLVVLAVVVPVVKLYPGPGWVTAGAALWAFALGVFWVLVMPNALWLARDARKSRLPALARLAHFSAAVYVLLGVVLPALLLGGLGGHPILLLLVFMAIAAGCLLFMLLPGLLAALLFAVFGVARVPLWRAMPPAVTWPGLSALATSALVLLVVWRWWQLYRASSPETGVLGPPMAWQYRLVRERGYLSAITQGGGKRGFLSPRPDVRRLDPAHPVRAIRMALGPTLMPQFPTATLLVWAAIAGLAATALLLGGGGFRHDAYLLLVSPALLGGLCGGAAAGALLAQVGQVVRRWSGAYAELPILALLPGLGSRNQVQTRVLGACLVKPVATLVVAGVIGWIVCIGLDRSYLLGLCTTLFVAAAMAMAVALVLGALSGRMLPFWIVLTVSLAIVVLLMLSFGLADGDLSATTAKTAGVALGWLALMAWLVVLALPRWRAFRRRAHPFLTGTA